MMGDFLGHGLVLGGERRGGREFARGIAAYASEERNANGKKAAARVMFARENIVVLEAAS